MDADSAQEVLQDISREYGSCAAWLAELQVISCSCEVVECELAIGGDIVTGNGLLQKTLLPILVDMAATLLLKARGHDNPTHMSLTVEYRGGLDVEAVDKVLCVRSEAGDDDGGVHLHINVLITLRDEEECVAEGKVSCMV